MLKQHFFQQLKVLQYIFRWILLCVPVGIIIGSAVALFLWLLNLAIFYRFSHPWLLYLLPVAGVGIHFAYKLYGRSAERGNNLIIDEIHEPGAGVPKRMAPLILVTTIVTHLFGGSAGREGTAVQIGGSLANLLSSWFKVSVADKQTLLLAGVAAGFGAVFGTPLTGAVFALEVIAVGRIQYTALLPCLIAALVGDATVAAWAVKHTVYQVEVLNITQSFHGLHLPVNLLLLLKVIVASAVFGLVSLAFAETVHAVKHYSLKWTPITWMIPVVGGLLIIGLTMVLGKSDYLSLGVNAEYPGAVTIVSAFKTGGAHAFSWFWKLVYTALTLGTGYKGGEVTPLFYIGATLGNSLAAIMDAPTSLFAALGFIAVFAGATNTPLACTLMGVELFGGEYTLLFAVACFTAYYFSGEQGIYSSQRIAVPRIDSASPSGHGYFGKLFNKYKP